MKQIFNELPRPTFRWMRVNHQELETPEVELVPDAAVEERHEGPAEVTFFTGRRVPNLGDFAGASRESLEDALDKGNVNCEISVKEGEKAKVWLDYSLSEMIPALIGQLYIKAGKNSDVEIFTTFEGDAPDGLVNVLFYVEAGENAKVTVSKVQIHGSRVRHIDQRYTRDGRGSKVKFVSAEVGGKESLVYVRTDLDHDESDFKSQTMYLGSEKQLFDFSYWVPTQGVKTNTDILTTGALMGTSRKYFRGTIDFLRGGKKAVGNEEDTCLLLNKGVHSISVPLLLCKEDDVVGNHAASSGQVDPDMLFYLMSRGLSENGARLVIVESNIRPVIDQLGDETLANKALRAVREKMEFCTQKGICDEKCTERLPNLN